MELPHLNTRLQIALLKVFHDNSADKLSFVPVYNKHIEKDILFHGGLLGGNKSNKVILAEKSLKKK